MSEPTSQAQGSPLERMVGLRARDRACHDCMGCGQIGKRVGRRNRLVKCPRCGGKGRVQINASPKPNDQDQVRHESAAPKH